MELLGTSRLLHSRPALDIFSPLVSMLYFYHYSTAASLLQQTRYMRKSASHESSTCHHAFIKTTCGEER